MFAFIAGVFFLVDVIRRNRKFSSLAIWSMIYVIVIGAHFLWRYSYYGFWLPNTFYVKVSGLWLEQSFKFLTYFNDDYRIIWFLPLFFIPFLKRPPYSSYLFLAVMCGHVLYLVYIGGDRFEFRFLVFIFPYLYLQIFEGLFTLTEIPGNTSWLRTVSRILVYGILGVLCSTTHLGSVRREAQDMRSYIMAIPGMREYARQRMWEGKFLRKLIDEGVLPADLYLSVGGAGAVPYYTMLPTLDAMGLNDLEIGHMKISKRGKIAHEKMASWEFLDKKQVEMCDGENRIVFEEPGKTGDTESGLGRWVSIKVDDHYLNFITFISEDQFRQRFNHQKLHYQWPELPG
jgi:arabinofuranosyltransferase